jgi:hypothetical protein
MGAYGSSVGSGRCGGATRRRRFAGPSGTLERSKVQQFARLRKRNPLASLPALLGVQRATPRHLRVHLGIRLHVRHPNRRHGHDNCTPRGTSDFRSERAPGLSLRCHHTRSVMRHAGAHRESTTRHLRVQLGILCKFATRTAAMILSCTERPTSVSLRCDHRVIARATTDTSKGAPKTLLRCLRIRLQVHRDGHHAVVLMCISDAPPRRQLRLSLVTAETSTCDSPIPQSEPQDPERMRRSGRPGSLPSRGSHGSGRAEFPHPALRGTVFAIATREDSRGRQRIPLQ